MPHHQSHHIRTMYPTLGGWFLGIIPPRATMGDCAFESTMEQVLSVPPSIFNSRMNSSSGCWGIFYSFKWIVQAQREAADCPLPSQKTLGSQ